MSRERLAGVVRLAVLVVGLFGLSGCAALGGGGEKVLEYREGESGAVRMRYLVSLPAGVGEKGRKLPLLMFLHGSGERGTDIQRVKVHGPAKMVGQLPVLSRFIVVSPQCPDGGRWDTVALKGLLEEVVERFPVDERRVYLTGLSLGGYGTWEMAARYPGLFAAVAPVCGGGNVELAGRLVGLPVWAFHGDLDSAVPVARSVEMVEAILAAGGEEARLTIYEGVGHDSWTRAYGSTELYTWMLSHKAGG